MLIPKFASGLGSRNVRYLSLNTITWHVLAGSGIGM